MDENERYLLDLQGYVAVPAALGAGELAELNRILDEHMAAEVAPDASTHRFGALLDWGPALRNLIDQPTITPYLEAILGPAFAWTMSTRTSSGAARAPSVRVCTEAPRRSIRPSTTPSATVTSTAD